MLWLKAFHIIAMVTWFAGLFYLPRLFVYHADARDALSSVYCEKRFARSPAASTSGRIEPGAALVAATPAYLAMPWLHAKLTLVALLIGYHAYCYALNRAFAEGRNVHTGKWYRVFNEIPSLLLIGIVVLAVVKP